MKFTLKKTSDYKFHKEITINTVEDLKALYNKFHCPLIVDFQDINEEEHIQTIEIYDDYRE